MSPLAFGLDVHHPEICTISHTPGLKRNKESDPLIKCMLIPWIILFYLLPGLRDPWAFLWWCLAGRTSASVFWASIFIEQPLQQMKKVQKINLAVDRSQEMTSVASVEGLTQQIHGFHLFSLSSVAYKLLPTKVLDKPHSCFSTSEWYGACLLCQGTSLWYRFNGGSASWVSSECVLAEGVIYGEHCGGSFVCFLMKREIMNHLLLKRSYKINRI